MTATNHTLTGMLIMAAVPAPIMLIPALLSHFILDSLPHFGGANHKSKSFLAILLADMTLASVLLLFILISQPAHWPLLIAGGILGASPDLMWLGPWLDELRGKNKNAPGFIRRFHSWIQWGERTWGIGIELIWLAGGLYLLAKIVQT